MNRSLMNRWVLAALTAGCAVTAGARVSAAVPAGVPVARLTLAAATVEVSRGDKWIRLAEGQPVRTGERVRTGPGARATLQFPWHSVGLGPSSVVSVPAEVILSLTIEQGRVEVRPEGADILRVRTPEASVRGSGVLVVRRDGERSLLMAMQGRFRVEAAGATVGLEAGKGTVVDRGSQPTWPHSLPEPPKELTPGTDPLYVRRGEQVSLRWAPAAARHHVEVLAFQTDDVLIQRDVGAPPLSVTIPWVGTYRWRVSSQDGIGGEGPPSVAGLICVID